MNKPIDKKMKLNRRTVLKTALGAGAAMSTPYFFVKAHAASDPKVMNMYNFDGSLGEFYTKHWYKPFQEKFDVKVLKVATLNTSGKVKQMTVKSGGKTIRTSGKRSDYKKAIVTLHRDSTIDFVRGEADN